MKYKGFTLIELLIVIAIIGILVGVALPSYQSHIRKANRVEAQIALTKMAQQFERINARQGRYPTSIATATISTASATIAAIDSPDVYTFVPSISTEYTFKITATPVAGGINADDACGTLSIKQTGETSAATSTCW